MPALLARMSNFPGDKRYRVSFWLFDAVRFDSIPLVAAVLQLPGALHDAVVQTEGCLCLALANSAAMVFALVAAGADVHYRSKCQESAMHFARALPVAEALVECGAAIGETDDRGQPPLGAFLELASIGWEWKSDTDVAWWLLAADRVAAATAGWEGNPPRDVLMAMVRRTTGCDHIAPAATPVPERRRIAVTIIRATAWARRRHALVVVMNR